MLSTIADEPAAVSATQNTLEQYDGGISPDAGGRAEYQEPTLDADSMSEDEFAQAAQQNPE